MHLKSEQLPRSSLTIDSSTPKRFFYRKKRSKTVPDYVSLYGPIHSTTLPTRFRGSIKTIKSLNFYCLSKIFDYCDYDDLLNCRLVCHFWNECVDFHLVRRKHFVNRKRYNSGTFFRYTPITEVFDAEKIPSANNENIPNGMRCISSKISDFDHLQSSSSSSSVLEIYRNMIFSCEKCQALNGKLIDAKIELRRQQQQQEQQDQSSPMDDYRLFSETTTNFDSNVINNDENGYEAERNDVIHPSIRSSTLSVSQTSLSSTSSLLSTTSLNEYVENHSLDQETLQLKYLKDKSDANKSSHLEEFFSANQIVSVEKDRDDGDDDENEDVDQYLCKDCQAILQTMRMINDTSVDPNFSNLDHHQRYHHNQGNKNRYHFDTIQNQQDLKNWSIDSNNNNNNNDDYADDQYYDQLDCRTLEKILSRLPNLISIKFAEGYRYGLKQRCLDVFGNRLILRTYRYCSQLKHIDLSNCIGLIETDFYHLAKFYGKQLLSLNVSGCRLDENCLRIIVKGCDKLRYLNVSNNFCRLQAGCFEWISDSIETIIADYNQNVRCLDGLLQGKGRSIIELELNVGYCFNPSMPYKILGNHFQNLISLKIIFKSFGKRNEGIFVHLSKLTELECLYLIEEIDDFDSESSLDDYSVQEILSSCGLKLRELYLHAASSLFGDRSSLTDATISKIDIYCPLLEVFSIKRASITDRSLEAIARLKHAYTVQLIDLDLISDNGIATIMTSFKNDEDQHKKRLQQICGIDINLSGKASTRIETLKRKEKSLGMENK
ncbi:hypothetical protein SSS_09101 [Sarcoptes scabiei]|uniref:F-box domain-containing protein n=1 Tax=Sarcoptes scabiei TaxID=52283 RepID=A0A834RHS1_SARSC|nr:hypothetical protein SSS_09101 [Sarcoptes scabiei]